MAGKQDMARFWDERARENALFYVDNRLDYRRPDEARFWADGERDLARLLELAGARIASEDRVVDVGCGVGRLTRAAAAQAAHVTGIDVSAEMLARAREHNAGLGNVTFVQGDGRTLGPLEDASADAVVSHVVFQHIPDPAITLGYVAEMGRVLRPGGWAAFQVSNDPRVHEPPRETLAQRLRRALGRAPRGVTQAPWRGSAVDLDALHATAEGAGLAVEHIDGVGTQFCIVRLRRR